MVRWIHICAWLLITFAVPGVIYSLVVGDWMSLVVNVLLIVIGVSDLLIVQDGDAILIANRKDESAVKEIVEELRKRGWENYL